LRAIAGIRDCEREERGTEKKKKKKNIFFVREKEEASSGGGALFQSRFFHLALGAS
jgi:hypothetical protein